MLTIAEPSNKPGRGYLSTSHGKWRVISQAMPICADKDTPMEALAAAETMRLVIDPAAWNGDRGYWVLLETIEELN